jgi:hypothetical protein
MCRREFSFQKDDLAMGALAYSILSEFYIQNMENTLFPQILRNTEL